MQITARSDFHGSNKPTIPLGMEVGDEEGMVAVLGAEAKWLISP